MKARAHVTVSGMVQGVFFRARAVDRANQLGVTGWVRNTPDGKVEAVIEGEKGRVEAMVEFCRNGPEGAEVKGIEIDWEDYRGEFRGFQIAYQ
jgi:acylphosphatase